MIQISDEEIKQDVLTASNETKSCYLPQIIITYNPDDKTYQTRFINMTRRSEAKQLLQRATRELARSLEKGFRAEIEMNNPEATDFSDVDNNFLINTYMGKSEDENTKRKTAGKRN